MTAPQIKERCLVVLSRCRADLALAKELNDDIQISLLESAITYNEARLKAVESLCDEAELRYAHAVQEHIEAEVLP